MNSSRGLHTPNIDRLAATGVVLTDYRVAPMCSPTRSATMCGRSIIRLGTQGNTLAVNAPWGINLVRSIQCTDC
jgi:arylsulfatase A-like enzyme